MMTILIFLLILGTLVLVHELGHFIVARRNGVVAEEFGFGFPPRIIGTYKDRQGKRRWVFGNKEIENEIKEREETVYSINLIPLGGFVKIKGEDGGDKQDQDSFAAKSVWVRFKILAAGVAMNFLLGIFLLTIAFWIGLPELVDDQTNDPAARIQIAQVMPGSPAEQAGISLGDEILAVGMIGQEGMPVQTIKQFQDTVSSNAGKTIDITVKKAGSGNIEIVKATPREIAPEGQGLLGVQLARTKFVSYPLGKSFLLAVEATVNLITAILVFLKDFFVQLVSEQKVAADVAGPVGIAVLTGQAAKLGLAYILQFAAMLSINLAVINFFPFPALDGGRIIFLWVEKLKGSPVSQKVEGMVHAFGFIFLISLMLLVTVKDFRSLNLLSKIKDLFM